jgi:hypothetical protein
MIWFSLRLSRCRVYAHAVVTDANASEKKADVVEHLAVFDHVGLLVSEPLGITELLFI